MQKEFDLVIYGATGFTGRLATQYLMRSADKSDLRIAIAGRNEAKLKDLQKSCKIAPQIIIADSTESDSINHMVQKTKVVLNFAGPFALYGEPVIAACVKFGTDYLDITGETPFISQMIKRYQQQALETGARLIPFSGFDSIPADLTVYLALDAAHSRNLPLDELCLYYQIKGGFNGGTLASALNMAEHANGPELPNSNCLIPDSSWSPTSPSNAKLHFEPILKRWTIPFFMAPINKAVVYRSSWLRSQLDKNDQPFQYKERWVMPQRFGYFQAILTASMQASFQFLSQHHFGRELLRRMGPKPGEGPSEEIRQNGFFRGQLICRHKGICKLIVRMKRQGDPGNEITVALACESGLLAVENAFQSNVKGFLTPTIAFGDKLKSRLEQAGFIFKIEFV